MSNLVESRNVKRVSEIGNAKMALKNHKLQNSLYPNPGNNFEISINDLAKKIIHQLGSSSEVSYLDYKDAYGDGFEDMERRVPNIDLIYKLVGWKPKRDLECIISDVARTMQ